MQIFGIRGYKLQSRLTAHQLFKIIGGQGNQNAITFEGYNVSCIFCNVIGPRPTGHQPTRIENPISHKNKLFEL